MMARHQSFGRVEVEDEVVKIEVHLWVLAASLETAARVAARERMQQGTAERLLADAELLRKLFRGMTGKADLFVEVTAQLADEISGGYEA